MTPPTAGLVAFKLGDGGFFMIDAVDNLSTACHEAYPDLMIMEARTMAENIGCQQARVVSALPIQLYSASIDRLAKG
jgi:hypothetical protein